MIDTSDKQKSIRGDKNIEFDQVGDRTQDFALRRRTLFQLSYMTFDKENKSFVEYMNNVIC
jgi:hypothetical protein